MNEFDERDEQLSLQLAEESPFKLGCEPYIEEQGGRKNIIFPHPSLPGIFAKYGWVPDGRLIRLWYRFQARESEGDEDDIIVLSVVPASPDEETYFKEILNN